MPLILNIQKAHYKLRLWHITEGSEFFKSRIVFYDSEKSDYNKIKRDQRKLEWLASRYLTKSLTDNAEIVKNEHGKPFLKNKSAFISISHCRNYAVCIVSKEFNVGIDIEPQKEKVRRIASKFLSEDEISFIENENDVKHLITCWAMKEAAYKWYGREYLSFKDNINIEAFRYDDNLSRIKVAVDSPKKLYKLKAFHLNIKGNSLVFCFAKKDLKILDSQENQGQ